jgi:hypothetical protein
MPAPGEIYFGTSEESSFGIDTFEIATAKRQQAAEKGGRMGMIW